MRTFVVGDIHGAYRALIQCLDRSGFDNQADHLICLGDVCDGWPETKQAIDKLLTINTLTYILGNHDFWTLEWMREGVEDDVWLSQGGTATVKSYEGKIPLEHIEFLERAKLYLVQQNKLFVHAGIDWRVPLERQSLQILLWDRSLAQMAKASHLKNPNGNLTGFDEVYIGHTPVLAPPHPLCEVWFMDTGAGWSGQLSMMDIETKEIFMSDPVPDLYPGVTGRSRK